MKKTKVKKKINKKALLVIILSLYLIIMIIYYVFTLPIKRIVINGNNLISDSEIIKLANIENGESIFKISTTKIKKNLLKNAIIEEVDIKKSLTGAITINITEAKALFYNYLNKTIVLSNKEEIEDETIIGLPTLINYVKSDLYEKLIEKMAQVDADIVSYISEIEYSPDIKDDITINDSRFILKMNDGNYVYIDLVNFENLNRYKVIYSNLDAKGIIHLDSVYSSGAQDTIVFTPFSALDKEVGDENELSQ